MEVIVASKVGLNTTLCVLNKCFYSTYFKIVIVAVLNVCFSVIQLLNHSFLKSN